ncbi:hypothetical protein WJX81_003658 [Elliptochloris bilobata]|uniref:tRNA-5-taurinomethyluridine 2-sulfurtransferase n=1 Tax=Elliptochloris bilobata TaxID=381761 RepID=A0AAW1QYE1_9CHLO
MLLKQQGHDVVGVFTRNWDEAEEAGVPGGCGEADLEATRRVAAQLRIPLAEADFTARYWHDVFADYVEQAGRGLTPNPDLPCNRHIKFGALAAWAAERGADALATGHYARLRRHPGGGPPQLLRAVDNAKDQSYFLAGVPGAALASVEFPVGGLLKNTVRALAAEAGLASAARRSSAGICFIGRRKYGEFLEGYAAPLEGRYMDVDSGADLGPCANLAALTHGQHASIGGCQQRMYVAGKDLVAGRAWAAAGRDHPALFSGEALAGVPQWVAGVPPAALAAGRPLHCQFKARYRQALAECAVVPAGAAPPLEPSALCRLLPEDAAAADAAQTDGLQVAFDVPVRAVTPGQALVLYEGEVRTGNVIESDGRLCEIVKFLHNHGAGRQLGSIQLELRDLVRGNKLHTRFRPYDPVEVVRLDTKAYQYLYAEGDNLVLMDPESFEQRSVSRTVLGEQAPWLVEGVILQLSLSGEDGDVLAGQLPSFVTLEVVDTIAPGDKGGSVSASYKQCTLSNGSQIMVPPSTTEGQRIVVDTRDGTYLRRAGASD